MRAHEYGAVCVLDCAQAPAHLPVDLHALGVDFAAFSAHKFYGLQGVGALFACNPFMTDLEPLCVGGGAVDEVWECRYSLPAGPARLEAGIPNVTGAVGFAAACRFIAAVGREEIRAHERTVAFLLLDGLMRTDCVEMLGSHIAGPSRVGIVSFVVLGVSLRDSAYFLDEAGSVVRTGSHCAQPLHRHLGLEGSCRASLGGASSEEDVERLCGAIAALR